MGTPMQWRGWARECVRPAPALTLNPLSCGRVRLGGGTWQLMAGECWYPGFSQRSHTHSFFHPRDAHRKAHTIALLLGVDGRYSRKSFTKLVLLRTFLRSMSRGAMLWRTQDLCPQARAQMIALCSAGCVALHRHNSPVLCLWNRGNQT